MTIKVNGQQTHIIKVLDNQILPYISVSQWSLPHWIKTDAGKKIKVNYRATGKKYIMSSSGCYWQGSSMFHTDDCACDEDYERSL